ncbi:MAG: hypothetical protein V3T60_13810, partial [Candidatus Binatia bacterium]
VRRNRKIFFFAVFASLRLCSGQTCAKNFVEVVLLNILSVRIYQTSGPLAKRTARKRGGLFGRRNAIVMQPRQAMILAINNAILVMLFAFAAWLCQRSRKMRI